MSQYRSLSEPHGASRGFRTIDFPTGALTFLWGFIVWALVLVLQAESAASPQTANHTKPQPNVAQALAGGLSNYGTIIALGQTDAEQALRGFPKNSWYDADTNQLIPPPVEPAEDEALRRVGRVSQARSTTPDIGNRANSSWDWNPSWLDISWLGPWLRVLVFAVIAIALALAVAVLTHFALRNYLPHRFRRQPPTAGVSIDPTRIVDLPFEVAAADGDPLAEAEHHLQAGNFDTAIVFLYGYLLLVLDQSRQIHLQKGKTNRMYLRELRGNPPLLEVLQQCMLVFESCYFGKHPVSRQQFLAVWHRVDEFHRLVHAPQSERRGMPLPAEATR